MHRLTLLLLCSVTIVTVTGCYVIAFNDGDVAIDEDVETGLVMVGDEKETDDQGPAKKKP